MQAKAHDHERTGGSRREAHAGTRTCVGCTRRVEASAVGRELVRIALVRLPEGGYEAHADVGGSSFGRGAWVHARRDCLTRAIPRGLARSARGHVQASVRQLEIEIAQQAERRAWALLGSARRARRIAVGADAVCAALDAGGSADSALVIVAGDARAAADRGAIQRAIVEGRALPFSDKVGLGEAFGREAVGVLAVLDAGIAEALRHALSLIATFGHLHQDDETGPGSGARQ